MWRRCFFVGRRGQEEGSPSAFASALPGLFSSLLAFQTSYNNTAPFALFDDYHPSTCTLSSHPGGSSGQPLDFNMFAWLCNAGCCSAPCRPSTASFASARFLKPCRPQPLVQAYHQFLLLFTLGHAFDINPEIRQWLGYSRFFFLASHCPVAE